MGGRLNKLVALNFISVFLFSLCYRSNRVIVLGVLSVFLFALGVGFVGKFDFDFSLEKPATRPRDRCGKEKLIYPFDF